MATTMRIPTEFTAVDKFTSVVNKMTAGVSNFSKSTQSAVMRVDNKLNKMWGSMDRLSQLALGAGVAGMFTLAIQNNIAYNESLQSVSAITGATGKDLSDLEKQAFKTAKAQNMLGADVFKAYELIASAKPELLKNTKLLDVVANSTSLLAKSAKMDMASSADSLTTSLNQFRLGGEKSLKVVDNLAAGTVYGASSIKQTTDALTKFGTVAAATGTKVDESIALIQLASPFEKGAEAGTKLRNILSKMAGAKILPKDAVMVLNKYGVNLDVVTNKSLPLATRLKEMGKIGKDTTAVMQVFELENQALAQAILQDTNAFDKMLVGVNEVGWAQKMAEKNTNTLTAGIEAMKNSFFNATTATNSNNKALGFVIDSMFFLSNNMETIIGIVGSVIAIFAGFKAVVTLIQIVTGVQAAYNAVMVWYSSVAVTAALTGASFAAVVWATLAPILAVIVAIGAIIAIFYYWDEIVAWFGKQWETFTNWIGSLWDSLVSWFQNFSFKNFFMQIGQSIIDFMLLPLRGVLELVSMLPGKMGEIGKLGLENLGKISMVQKLESPQNTQANIANSNFVNGQVNVNVATKNGATAETNTKNKGGIPIKVTSTQGAF